MARALGEMFVDLAPDEGPVQQHIGAVRRVNRRAIRPQRFFRIHHERQWFIADANFFSGVFGQRAAIGNDRNHPFTGIAGLPDRERVALNLRRIKPVHQRIGRSGKLIARQHIMNARHRQRR